VAWNNPFSPDRIFEVLDVAGVQAGSRVLDVGCGTGELLVALGRRGVTGVGIDRDPEAVARAQAAAAGLDVAFVEGDAAKDLPRGPFSLVACLGAAHAFGAGNAALPAALEALRDRAPGGHLLLGEGYQRRPLPPEYARFLGQPTGIDRTLADLVDQCEGLGLSCVHAITASEAEWDAFEWAHFRRQRARAAALPRAEADALLTQAHAWREAWLQWGRAAMGFALVLIET
jgi:SAM-dependent methyltransferase